MLPTGLGHELLHCRFDDRSFEKIWIRAGHQLHWIDKDKLTKPEEDYLDVLTDLVEAYETSARNSLGV